MANVSARGNTFRGNKVPRLTKIFYPWSGIFRDACYALIGTFLIQYAITSGVLDTGAAFTKQYGVITIAMMIALLWDGINDPIMGFILEKCHFKMGKFRPWIAIGSVGNAVVVALMFLCPFLFSGLRGWGYVAFMIVMYILWDTFFTINDIGYWSMLPSLTNDPKERAKLTTHTAIATSIGTFVMNIAMFVLPGSGLGKSAKELYMIVGLGVAILFLVSQLLVFFLCKEKERDAEQEEVSEKSSILDLFRVLKKNKELLFAAVGMLFYYFGSFILTGIGQNYFYMIYGYGGMKGGMVATGVSLIYVIATVAAQAFFPMLAKHLSKKKILTIMSGVILVAYLGFFLTAFPLFGDKPIAYNTPTDNIMWIFGGSMSLIYIFAFLFFGAAGIFYLAVLVMFQDAIDYGEVKNGERKESICFAWRPLDVKLASGLNRGLQFLVYAMTGTMSAINAISDYEGKFNAGEITEAEMQTAIQGELDAVSRNSKIWFGVIVIGVILLVFALGFFFLRFKYSLDEAKVKEINAQLNQKAVNQEEDLVLETAGGAPVEDEIPDSPGEED